MEKLLEEAFKKVSSLPEKEKKAFAAFIIEELEHEERWEELYKKSEPDLRSLAREALEEYKKGNTGKLDSGSF